MDSPPPNEFASLKAITKAQEASTRPYKRRRGAPTQNPALYLKEAREEVIHILHRLKKAAENY